MVEDMKETGRVQFLTEHEVKKVVTKQGKVIISGNTSSGSFETIGDSAVITVPLGVLKSSAIEFNPPLPEAKLGCISRLGMGLLNKVCLVFSKLFWDEEVEWLNTASSLVPWFLNLQYFTKK